MSRTYGPSSRRRFESPPVEETRLTRIAGKRISVAICAAFVLAGTVLATCGNASASSGSNSAAQGERFTKSLLARAPCPEGTVPVAQLPMPLVVIGASAGSGTIDVHRDYLLTLNFSLASFIASHRPPGAVVGGPDSEVQPTSITTYEYSLPLLNRHISFESLDYTVGYAPGKIEELRIDAQVDWSPIQTAVMPTAGIVRLTGYGRLSDMDPSSDPTSVVLTTAQAIQLRNRISALTQHAGRSLRGRLDSFHNHGRSRCGPASQMDCDRERLPRRA